jgi:hypothetical protein
MEYGLILADELFCGLRVVKLNIRSAGQSHAADAGCLLKGLIAAEVYTVFIFIKDMIRYGVQKRAQKPTGFAVSALAGEQLLFALKLARDVLRDADIVAGFMGVRAVEYADIQMYANNLTIRSDIPLDEILIVNFTFQ